MRASRQAVQAFLAAVPDGALLASSRRRALAMDRKTRSHAASPVGPS
jgi:hypothetical protein